MHNTHLQLMNSWVYWTGTQCKNKIHRGTDERNFVRVEMINIGKGAASSWKRELNNERHCPPIRRGKSFTPDTVKCWWQCGARCTLVRVWTGAATTQSRTAQCSSPAEQTGGLWYTMKRNEHLHNRHQQAFTFYRHQICEIKGEVTKSIIPLF